MANQANYKDNQSFEIDIELFYEDFIKQIDSIRGYVNISSPQNTKFLNNISASDFAGISGKLAIEKKFQESRIHAFYRLIGFPILGNNNQFYSPGFDAIKSDIFFTRKQNKQYKLNIINNIKSNFYEFSKEREEYYNTKIKQWYSYQDINTITYLLSSYNKRFFNSHIEKYEGTFDLNIDNQSYLVKLSDSLNRSLLEYSFFNGVEDQFPTKLISKRFHPIFPLLCDPRLDLSASKKVCIPFPLNKSHTVISEVYEAPRCILEGIITERFNDGNLINKSGNGDSTFINNLNNFINNFTDIKDEFLIQKANEKFMYSPSEQEVFNKIINIIVSMIDELILAQKDIDFVTSNTYWTPICGLDGPEVELKSIEIQILSNPKFLSQLDKELAIFQKKDLLNSIIPQSAKQEEFSDNGLSLSGFVGSFFNSSAKFFGNAIKSSYDYLNKQKKYFDNKGNSALRKIEIIMGEFSGLGLCDIVAIIGGLYLVDRKYLLGLIDEDAFQRANNKLKLINFSQPTLEESMQELNKVIFSLYNIMEKIYTDKSKFGV